MAYEFYVSIEGATQGKFHGESPKKDQAQKIPGLAFHYEVVSPRDPASGLPTGKRQHKPISFLKEWGAATPQLFQALVTNENLKTVKFEFLQVDKTTGKEGVYFTIDLTNATVADIKQSSGSADGADAAKHSSSQGIKELETITLAFQKITLTYVKDKTSAMDDWESQK